MVDLQAQYQNIEHEIDTAIKQVINSSSFINGQAVKDFSKNLAEFLDVKHVIPCGNGTDALQIALMALDLKPGDEVITSTFTFIATAEVIALLGLTPVFVDVDLNNFNLLPNEVESKISSKTKVILPVHLFGQCAPMEDIIKIAEKHNLFIVEDTAQALGAEYQFLSGKKKKAGTIGHFGTTSFFPSKNLGCYGDGGALFTNDTSLAEKAKMITNHGSKTKYKHEIIGVNSRLDTIQAAVLNIKLKKLETYNKARLKVAQTYKEQLSEIDWIKLPNIEEYSSHVFHQFTIQISNGKRDEFKEFLKSKKIPTMIYYPTSLHNQTALRKYKSGIFKNAENLESNVLSLPIHTELNLDTILYIVKTIKSYK